MRFFYIFIITLAILIILSWQAHAETTITYFYDGDTVKIADDTQQYKLRINDIDAPERNQRYGKKSRRALMSLCQNATVKVVITGVDRYQRQLGDLYCNQEKASVFMVTNGHAWFNQKYTNDEELGKLQEKAREQKYGLWLTEHPMPPWVWRKLHQTALKKSSQPLH